MDEAKLGLLRVAWDANDRILHVIFDGPSPSTFERRAVLAEKLRAWTAGNGPYDVLASCAPQALVDVHWRLFWADFFAKDRQRARIACHGLGVADRFFLRATGAIFRFDAATFSSEDEARAWLAGDSAPVSGAVPVTG